ncbi:MAG TPA: response regulator [Terriglobia bacterium]|jgi:DNA-binding response OmpR family regulator|nr:response regulator [Terriglobia bacterium]
MTASILLVVSDALIRKVLGEVMESAGYNVFATGDLGSAVDYLNIYTPDLLMIRHYTDGISGYDAAMNIRRRVPGIAVLMVGGLPDDSRLINRDTVQGFEIFPKPFPAAELLEKVAELLLRRSNRSETSQ